MTCCSALSFAFQTEKGSALHEAALFGKTDVVQILLAAGERSAALSFTWHAGVGLFSLASSQGDCCWLHLNPMYVCLHGLTASVRVVLEELY